MKIRAFNEKVQFLLPPFFFLKISQAQSHSNYYFFFNNNFVCVGGLVVSIVAFQVVDPGSILGERIVDE